MDKQLKFVSDMVHLMQMVKSSSVVLSGFSETWSVEVMVNDVWPALLDVLFDLSSKNYRVEMKPFNNMINILVRHPDYLPF